MSIARCVLVLVASSSAVACSGEHGLPKVRGFAFARSASAQPTPAPQRSPAERVWVPGDADETYDVSPDGRLAAYIDWDTGNLGVRDLVAGTNRNLTNKGTYKDSEDEAESAVFSPDGRRLAYEWWDSKTKNDEIRLINTDGSGTQTIYRETKVDVWPEEFTPDGRFVVTLLDDDKEHRIALVPTAGGPPRMLTTYSGRNVVMKVSPDSRYVAYSIGEANDDFRRDIFIVAVDNGRPTKIVENPADDYPVGWTRDGSRLIFASDRGGSPGIWTMAMRDGRPSGEPVLVRGDLWRMDAIRLTSNGRLYYNVAGGDRDIFTAPIDLETGRLLSPPVSLTGHPGEHYFLPEWSPDGKYVAYLRSESSGVSHTFMMIHAVGGDEVREFLPRIFAPRTVTWIPQSRSMMMNGNDENNHPTLYRFDLETGKADPVIANSYSIPSFSPDGRTLYYAPRVLPNDTASRLIARDLATGAERLVYVHKGGGRINANAATSDGRFVILVWVPAQGSAKGRAAGVFSVSTETGAVHNLGETIPFDSARQTETHAGFTPDQKSVIIFVQRVDSLESYAFWRVPLEGGRAVRLPSAPAGLQQIAGTGGWLSPDGRRIAFVKGTVSHEVWALDDPRLR